VPPNFPARELHFSPALGLHGRETSTNGALAKSRA
jgi:hypothetical protein